MGRRPCSTTSRPTPRALRYCGARVWNPRRNYRSPPSRSCCTTCWTGSITLPEPQAAALGAAFGLAESPEADRFLAGLATLTLLSEVAADGPLLCVIDDTQWLDRASIDTLLFAGRRLGAEGIVLLLAVRDVGVAEDFRGLTVLGLPGLSSVGCCDLLAERAADLAPGVRDRLIGEATGNPLALIELAAALREWNR